MLAIALVAGVLAQMPAALEAAPLREPKRAEEYLPPLGDEEVRRAKAAIGSMAQNERGAYAGVAWYCNDGTEQLPKLNGCAPHGGGKMYGVLSPDAIRLGRRGLFVGTILAPLTLEELFEADYYRARALVVERYLERALDGWVLKAAKSYRGFRQDEDEAVAARFLLMGLAGQKAFQGPHRALLIRLSRALPYGRGAESLAVEIRALAAVLGDEDREFAPLRFKIHALPEPKDIAPVLAYAAQKDGPLRDKASELAEKMRTYYDPATRLTRLKEVQRWIWDKKVKAAIDDFTAVDPTRTLELLERGLALLRAAERPMWQTLDLKQGERYLLLLHTMGLVEELWLATSADLAQRPLTRTEALLVVSQLSEAASYVGLLSEREHEAARATLERMRAAAPEAYAAAALELGRVIDWARARLTSSLAVPLARYQAVEPQAVAVIDDILRSGVMLPLGVVLDRIAADAETLRGGGHQLVGVQGGVGGLRGENPGLAVGPLRIVPPGGELHGLSRGDVVLLHELPPELPPVAGVLTVGAPGSVSHVALLARNLGIPLAAVSGELAQALAAHAGREVVLGVSSGRRVVLGEVSALSPEQLALVRGPTKEAKASLHIDASALDLATTRILRLDEVSEADAGVRMGPKAAELGRLRRMFPERVSDAAIIPFGAFLRHVDGDGDDTPWKRLRAAYATFARAGRAPESAAAAEAAVLAASARFRDEILTRPLPPGFDNEVSAALERLGGAGKIGVFVRSDTNVEDLKDFTGAGLNLTVPNRVRPRDILQAIREVWASPYTERSFRWRQRLLDNPEHVYPSVLLHKTVPSEISGVMVTMDLDSGAADAITVSAAEGVAAVVDGGAPETLVLLPGGKTRLVASFRSATRKIIPRPPKDGVQVEVASTKEPLLSERHVAELRALAAEVLEKIPPKAQGLPWDIEWGLYRNRAYLMQIRPLKLSRAAATHPFLVRLDAAAAPPAGVVDLAAALP